MEIVLNHVESINIRQQLVFVYAYLDLHKLNKKMVALRKSIVQKQMKLLISQDMNAFVKKVSKEILRLKIAL